MSRYNTYINKERHMNRIKIDYAEHKVNIYGQTRTRLRLTPLARKYYKLHKPDIYEYTNRKKECFYFYDRGGKTAFRRNEAYTAQEISEALTRLYIDEIHYKVMEAAGAIPTKAAADNLSFWREIYRDGIDILIYSDPNGNSAAYDLTNDRVVPIPEINAEESALNTVLDKENGWKFYDKPYRKIHHNKVYDTSTAKLWAEWSEYNEDDELCKYAVYRKKSTEFFFYVQTGATRYIEPLGTEEAKQLMKKKIPDKDVTAINTNPIKELRVKKGLTQEELAKMLGVTSRTVENWDVGKSYPNKPTEAYTLQLLNSIKTPKDSK